MSYSRGGWGNDWVDAVPSGSFNFCVLAGAKRSEWGQYGTAKYCLLDSTGSAVWSVDGQICAPPAVADNGVVAMLSLEGRPASLWRPDSLRVDFAGQHGRHLGSAKWGKRSRRPTQHYPIEDVYDFSPNGQQFFITVNESDQDTVFADTGALYAVAVDGTIEWRRELGEIRPNELIFSASGDRIVITDLRMAAVGYQNQVLVFDASGRLVARRAIPEARGADGSVLDVAVGALYAYSFRDGIVAVNLETGKLTKGLSTNPLFRLQRSSDPRTVARAKRIVERVRGARAKDRH